MESEGRHGRAELWGVALVTLLGAFFRLQGLRSDLWVDEAFWARQIVDGTMLGDPKRPPGFTLLAGLAASFSLSEVGLRAVSFVSSVAMVPLAWALARRLHGSRAAALAAAVLVATTSSFIDFAKEFKPYVFEAAGHLLLALLALRYAARPSARRLVPVCAGIVLAAPWGTSLVFLLPGVVLVAGAAALAHGSRAERRALAASVVLSLAVIGWLWAWSWSRPVGDSAYWGSRYEVFDLGTAGHLAWLRERLGRTVEVAFAAPDPLGWALVERLARFWKLAFLVGALGCLLARRWRPLALCALPIALAALFNGLGRWPFGPFRTNQFLLAHVQLLALAPLGLLAGRSAVGERRWVRPSAVLALAVLLLLRLPPRPGHYLLKGRLGRTGEVARTGTIRAAMWAILEHDGPEPPAQPVRIVSDPWTLAREYYLTLHPGFTREHAAAFEQRYVWRTAPWEEPEIEPLVREAIAEGEPFWIVRTWEDPEELERFDALEVTWQQSFAPGGYAARVRVRGGSG